MGAVVTWKDGLAFTGAADSGFSLPLDASSDVGGGENGFRPMELLLVGLAGCTAMDVISILRKKKQDVTNFEVRVHGDKASEHPKVFTRIFVEYIVTGHQIDPAAVERAVDLSTNRYCPAQAMLGKAAPIEHKITIVEAA